MRAVWSFWTKPWRARRGFGWSTEKHHLLAWVLSVECARRHYPDTHLVTDEEGARILVDGIGLSFNRVSTELDELSNHDPDFWMLGKLKAYRAQRDPFIHLDTDFFLWNRLPKALEQAQVFAQHPEQFRIGQSFYRPDRVRSLLTQDSDGWLPPEWEWSLSLGDRQRGECCGITGGSHLDFIRYYAEGAMRVIDDPRNRSAWSAVADRREYNVVIEQFHLAACVDFHRGRSDSPYRDVDIRYLFSSASQAFNPNQAVKAGFTHLIAGAKHNVAVTKRLEKRVAKDYPEQYERCVNYARRYEVHRS